jgi:hypothetical protein
VLESGCESGEKIFLPVGARGRIVTYRLPEFGDRFPSPDDVRRIWGSLMLRVGGLLLLGFEVRAVGVPDPEVTPEGAMVG